MLARKPPTRETELYREAFREEWNRSGSRITPAPSVMAVLADSALQAGLDPASAALSSGRAIGKATERVIRARNPEGLIVHIARETWKAS